MHRPLRVILLLAFINAVHSSCPKDFELVRMGDCYKQVKQAMNVYSRQGPDIASDKCNDLDAHPVFIRNQDDHDYWVAEARAQHAKGSDLGRILIGIECVNHIWQFTDGSPLTFTPAVHDSELDGACEDFSNQYCMWTVDAQSGGWVSWCNTYQNIDLYCVASPERVPGAPDQTCTDFEHDDEDDVCYQVGATAANWTEANTVCRSFGAKVASIHNQKENTFLRRLAVSKGLVNGILLGGTLLGKSDTFGWIDGSDWDYDHFAPGFPIDGFGDCLAMETNNVDGPWINIDCTAELPYACIRQTADAEPKCDGALRKEGEIIFSPGFPYNSSVPCDFLLKVDPGMLVEVNILMLEANTCCDHLILTEGTLGGALLADLSGETNSGKTYRTKTQNVMRASWQPHGAFNVKGVMMSFRAVPK